uniref:Cell division protein n=1 Tax=Gloeotilopsis planctonica TaxID=34157 RepID=A0A1B2RZ20_9CHLO|nr:cell division protein [Gloeotilopsis planctonica]
MQFFSLNNSSNWTNFYQLLKKKRRFQKLKCQSFQKQINFRSKIDRLKITYLSYLPKPISLNPSSFYCLNLKNKKAKFFFKAQVLNDTDFDSFNSKQLKKTKNFSWKKSIAIFYYLLDAYKKTLQAKITSYFQSSTNLQFLLAASPFIAYFIQLNLQQYGLKYQQNTFFEKTLPGVTTPVPQITWETYAYSRYANKLNNDFILQVNSLDDGFFIYLNSNWHFQQKQLSTGTFSTPNSSLKWSFLPSRYFYQFLTGKEKKEVHQIFFQKNSFLTLSKQKSNSFEINSRLQAYFNEFDEIPIKLNSVFLEPSELVTLENKIQNSFISESFSFQNSFTRESVSVQIFDEDLSFKSSFCPSAEFQNQFLNLSLNYHYLTFKGQKEFQTKALLKSKFPDKMLFKLTEKQNWRGPKLKKEKKSQFIRKQIVFVNLNSQKIVSQRKLFPDSKPYLNNDLIGVSNQATLANESSLCKSNFQSQKVLTTLDFDVNITQAWANLLNDTFSKEVKKKFFYDHRSFQYTTQLGFSRFGKILQNAISVSQETGAPKLWKKRIVRDLTKSFPNWVNELVNQKSNFKTFNFSLLKANFFETLLTKSLLVNTKTLSPLLNENPEFFFQYFKAFPVEKTEKSKSQNLPFFKDNSNPFYFQRKVSGYLYPDSFQNSFLKNPNFFQVNLKQYFEIREKKNLAESYSQGFLEIIKSVPKQSLIYVYQPLLQPKEIASFCNFLKQNQFLEDFSIEKNLENQKSLEGLQPHKAITAHKYFFFGVPRKSPLYELTFEKYKKKYVNYFKIKLFKKSSQKYEFINYTKKKNPPKHSLVFPYRNFPNFLLKANQSFEENQSFSKLSELKFTNEKVFNELSKALTFSDSDLEKKNLVSFCPKTLQKLSKEFAQEQSAIPYKTSVHYTNSKSLNLTKNFFSNSTEKTFSKNQNTVSNSFFKSVSKNFKNSSSATDLYEPIDLLKSWSILSQLGFFFILFKLSKLTQKEYTEEILFYVDEFYAFLNDYEKNLLDILIPEDTIRVIQKQSLKFQNVVGGEFFLSEFGEVIVLVRNSQKKFFKWQIEKPNLVKVNPLYLKLFSNFQVSQILRLSFQNFVSVFNKTKVLSKFLILKDLVLFDQNFFHFLTEKKTNLKFENFIPKGILLVGPPGTGKTLFVKAFAGETKIPIIVESGKTLSTNKESSGAERLKELFQAAQKMSPCILFFDEIDTIGQKRQNVISTSMISEIPNETPNTLKKIYLKDSFSHQELATSFFENTKSSNDTILNPVLAIQANEKPTENQSQRQIDFKIQLTNEKRLAGEKQNRDLAMLTQLLYELDGLTKKQEIIVIGATNRPATLDSALTRPGRFGKILYLDLPGKQKRFELLKYYSDAKSKSFFLAEKPTLNFCWFSIFDHLVPQLSFFSHLNYLKFFQKTKFQKIKKFRGNLKLTRPFVFSFSNLTSWKNFFFLRGQKLFREKPKNLNVDSSVDWNYFANQTLGLSSAHLSAAMNRSAFKTIFSYLSKEDKKTSFSNFFIKRFEVKNQFHQKLPNKTTLSSEKNFYTKVFFEKTNIIEKFKNYKLKIFRDSTAGSPQVFKKLFLIYNFDLTQKNPFLKATEKKPKKQLHENSNSQLSHSFESVEYGIQTIMTTTSRPQLKFKKAKQLAQKLMGQFSFDDLIEKKFQKANVHFDLKRKKFFEKHRCYLKTLAFLKGFISNFSYEKTEISPVFCLSAKLLCSYDTQKARSDKKTKRWRKKSLKRISFLTLTFAKLKVLKRYLTRIILNNSFGWVVLFNSTCLFQNSLFLFSFQKQNHKSLSDIYFSILAFENFNFKNCFQSLLKWKNVDEKCQKSLFGDSFFLTRSVYYLSGKAIIHFSNNQKKQIDPSIHLWSFLGYYQTRQKKPSIENAFLSKIQFENFVLSLVAGKAAESLMLANQSTLWKKKNVSNIGFEEIQKGGFFLQLMHKKFLFYSQKALTRKQINICLVENKKQINQEELLFLNELASLFEIQKKTLASSSLSHLFQKQNQFRSVEQPWWQFETFNLLASSNLKYAHWYRLLIAQEHQTFRNIEWVGSDNFFHIQPNNFSLVSNQTSVFEEKGFALNYSDFLKLNWNQVQLFNSTFQISYFLFESFNKVFSLLETNRELVDFLAYDLLCNEKKRPFEIVDISKRFFN